MVHLRAGIILLVWCWGKRPVDRLGHVDGLRALAVIVVLFFHLGFPAFSGGFVGVDIFFVISGYVITRLIAHDLDKDRFSFSGFYIRRALRLMPALLVVVALCSLAAILLLMPAHFQSFSQSVIATLTGWSNILFWSESGYFDAAALKKPLLHTWSLSVEWQFYAVWPALLFLSYRFARRWTPLIIVAVGVVSFAANYVPANPTSIFFLPQFRAFEFAVGAVLAWAPRIQRGALAELATLSGLALIGYSVWALDEQSWFPGHNALAPVIGTALLIWSAGVSRAGLVVNNAVAEHLGRASYSTYLVHWPLIVFFTYATFRPMTTAEALSVAAVSLLLGSLMYRYVEWPFWKGRFARLPRLPVALAAACLMIIWPAYTARTHGWMWRLDPEMVTLAKITEVQKSVWGRSGCNEPCIYGSGPKDVLVMGDSHVDHYAKSLEAKAKGEFRFFHLHGGSCYFGADLSRPDDGAGCIAMNAKKTEWLKSKLHAVVHAQRWPGYSGKLADRQGVRTSTDPRETFKVELADLEKLYADFRGKVIVLNFVPSINFSCLLRPKYLPLRCPAPDLQLSREFAHLAREMTARHDGQFVFMDPADYLCPEGRCSVVTENKKLLHVDESGHLSKYGAGILAQKIVTELRRPIRHTSTSLR
jgi:peptidoglycan/LPS O-acetylase OafA/YrhL